MLRRPAIPGERLELALRPELARRVVQLHELRVRAAPAVVECVALRVEVLTRATVPVLRTPFGRELLERQLAHGSTTSSGIRPTGSPMRDSQNPATNETPTVRRCAHFTPLYPQSSGGGTNRNGPPSSGTSGSSS